MASLQFVKCTNSGALPLIFGEVFHRVRMVRLNFFIYPSVGFAIAISFCFFVSNAKAQVPDTQSAPQPINPLTGPSFPCPQPDDPLAQLICSTPKLALLDMQLVQTYEALYQQVGSSGDQALVQDDLLFNRNVRSTCGIALAQSRGTSPAPPPAPDGSELCVIPAYQQQIALWQGQLQGAAAEEASRSIQDQVALQSRLRALGFLPSQDQLDGVFGPATRAAIIQWQTSVGRQPTGLLGNDDAQALLGSSTPNGTAANATPQQHSSSGENGGGLATLWGWIQKNIPGAGGSSAAPPQSQPSGQPLPEATPSDSQTATDSGNVPNQDEIRAAIVAVWDAQDHAQIDQNNAQISQIQGSMASETPGIIPECNAVNNPFGHTGDENYDLEYQQCQQAIANAQQQIAAETVDNNNQIAEIQKQNTALASEAKNRNDSMNFCIGSPTNYEGTIVVYVRLQTKWH